MTCVRCRIKMKELRRSFHKKRKWKCPSCGSVRMQAAQPRIKQQIDRLKDEQR